MREPAIVSRFKLWRPLPRLRYASLLAFGILAGLISVVEGAVCKSISTFDFVQSFLAPLEFFSDDWFISYPALLILTLIILPFAPVEMRRRSVNTLIAVPCAIYIIIGGSAAVSLHFYPVSGCF
jgi:hypothetical protein